VSLASDLSYEFPRANWFRRAMKAFASTRPGAWFFSRMLRRFDDVFQKVTGGRTTSAEVLAGLPVLDVTTTGRKSGQPRTSHLISIPLGDALALIGTNFGQANTPAWVFNLEADPSAMVRYRDKTAAVTARLATGAEAEEVLTASEPIYPGYRKYQTRIGESRRLRIFLLEPVGPSAA
jgi:deazaflavin-dependent oxidoreductase (nitroreductase family)